MYPLRIKAHERSINTLRFNYDGDLFFTGQADRLINVFESYTGELLGSYPTKVAVKTLDVDINSKYVIYGSFTGKCEVFNVTNGEKMLATDFESLNKDTNKCELNKIYHLEFDVSSKKLMIVYEFGQVGHIRIIDFDHLVSLMHGLRSQDKQVSCNQVKVISNFSIKTGEDEDRLICEKAKWYADNESLFLGTNTGDVMHFSQDGKLIKKAKIHAGVKIKSVSFSHDFSILATAAGDGCKVLNPETLEIMRVFKQQYPMNDVSISPLFNHPMTPKHHLIMGGGVDAKQAARTKGAGFDVHLCNVMYEKQIGKLLTHFSPINSIQFFRDGLGYACVAEDSLITIVRFEENYFTDPVYE